MTIASMQILNFFKAVEIFNFWPYFYAISAISLKHQRYQTTNTTLKWQSPQNPTGHSWHYQLIISIENWYGQLPSYQQLISKISIDFDHWLFGYTSSNRLRHFIMTLYVGPSLPDMVLVSLLWHLHRIFLHSH